MIVEIVLEEDGAEVSSYLYIFFFDQIIIIRR
jgi:hypothetical protein